MNIGRTFIVCHETEPQMNANVALFALLNVGCKKATCQHVYHKSVTSQQVNVAFTAWSVALSGP